MRITGGRCRSSASGSGWASRSGEPRLRVDRNWVEQEWVGILAHAAIDEGRAQLIVVEERQPDGTAECAYCPPSMGPPLAPRTNKVITRIHPDLLAQNHHIVGVWQELPEADTVLLSALLRHELEHARQWERYGPQLTDELDPELKEVARSTGRCYHAVPCERAADDAARSWVRSHYGANEVDRLTQSLPHWRDVPEGCRDIDLHAATVAALREWAPPDYEVAMSNANPVTVEDFVGENSAQWPGLPASPRGEGGAVEFAPPWQPG